MARSTDQRQPIDWPAWFALAWAGVFGLLYGRMVLEERAPKVLRAVERLVGRSVPDQPPPIKTGGDTDRSPGSADKAPSTSSPTGRPSFEAHRDRSAERPDRSG